MDSNEESEPEEWEEDEECDSDIEHDCRVEYLFELAKTRWNFHPFVVDILREVGDHIIALNTFSLLNAPQLNRWDPIPEGPQGIQLLDDLALLYDVVSISLFDSVGGV